MMSWLATPTPATASSAYCESINVSVAPMNVTRSISMKIGRVSVWICLRSNFRGKLKVKSEK